MDVGARRARARAELLDLHDAAGRATACGAGVGGLGRRRLWFSTSPQSQKGRNLARDPHVVVHLESGDDVVILEGDAVRSECPDRVREAYETKYAYRLEPGNSDTPLFAVRPRVAQTWRERDFPKSAVRWVFD